LLVNASIQSVNITLGTCRLNLPRVYTLPSFHLVLADSLVSFHLPASDPL
jgi:hypothetical protein